MMSIHDGVVLTMTIIILDLRLKFKIWFLPMAYNEWPISPSCLLEWPPTLLDMVEFVVVYNLYEYENIEDEIIIYMTKWKGLQKSRSQDFFPVLSDKKKS